MSGDWLTYRELADRLGVSVEAENFDLPRRPDGAPDVHLTVDFIVVWQ